MSIVFILTTTRYEKPVLVQSAQISISTTTTTTTTTTTGNESSFYIDFYK